MFDLTVTFDDTISAKEDLSGATLIPNASQVSALANVVVETVLSADDFGIIDSLSSRLSNIQDILYEDFVNPVSAELTAVSADYYTNKPIVLNKINNISAVIDQLSADIDSIGTGDPISFGMYFNIPTSLKLPAGILYWNNYIDSVCAELTAAPEIVFLQEVSAVLSNDQGEITGYSVELKQIEYIKQVEPTVRFIPNNTIISSDGNYGYDMLNVARLSGPDPDNLSAYYPLSSSLSYVPLLESQIPPQIKELSAAGAFDVMSLTCPAANGGGRDVSSIPSTTDIPIANFCPIGIENPTKNGNELPQAYMSKSVKLIHNTSPNFQKEYRVGAVGRSVFINNAYSTIDPYTTLGAYGGFRGVKMDDYYSDTYLAASKASDIATFVDETKVVIPTQAAGIIRTAGDFNSNVSGNSVCVYPECNVRHNAYTVILNPDECLIIDIAPTPYGRSTDYSNDKQHSFYLFWHESKSTKLFDLSSDVEAAKQYSKTGKKNEQIEESFICPDDKRYMLTDYYVMSDLGSLGLDKTDAYATITVTDNNGDVTLSAAGVSSDTGSGRIYLVAEEENIQDVYLSPGYTVTAKAYSIADEGSEVRFTLTVANELDESNE